MPGSLRPEDVAGKTFKAGWRGYDQGAVEGYLRDVSSSIASLQAENDRLRERLHKLGDRDMHEEFDRVSEELTTLLNGAREMAEGMRSRAAVDAEAITNEASEDAVKLRQDAWNDGVALLESAVSESEGIVEEAKRSALSIISEAERDAHRVGAKARRDADETTRRARLQAEQVVVDARARRDGLVQEGEAEVAAVQERVNVLAERRDELLEQIDSLQMKIGELRSELEDRRAEIGKARAADTTTVRVLPIRQPEEEPEAQEAEPSESRSRWDNRDESVRIVPAPRHRRHTGVVDADEMAAEVRQLRVPRPAREPEPEIEDSTAEEPVEPVAEEPTVEQPAVEEPAEPVAEEPKEEGGPVRGIRDLFASLRAADDTPPTTQAEQEPEPAVEPEPEEDLEETTLEAEPVFEEPEGLDPFELRDRLLLPITNKTLRTVKRGLTEAQNIALDELRVQEDAWEPDVEALEASLVDDLHEVLQRAAAAGWEAAGRLLGRDVGEPSVQVGGSPAQEFAEAIGIGVQKALDDAGDGPRRRAAAISRVYRAWRVDEAERKVRMFALGAYHDGLLAAFAQAGVAEVRWLPAGRPCTTCRTMIEAGPIAPGSLFGGELARPPAHVSCECTLTLT